MKNQKLLLWGLSVLSAVLMSLPFLVPHCGFFALFGLVPLLCRRRTFRHLSKRFPDVCRVRAFPPLQKEVLRCPSVYFLDGHLDILGKVLF